MIAIDTYSRLPVASAGFLGTVDDIIPELDRTGQQLGYPDEISIDPGFKFSTPALREWGVQRGISQAARQTERTKMIVARPPQQEPRAPAAWRCA
jgi:hypothetical protein